MLQLLHIIVIFVIAVVINGIIVNSHRLCASSSNISRCPGDDDQLKIRYPFWIDNRTADDQGDCLSYPEFQIKCAANGRPVINVSNNIYYVLNIEDNYPGGSLTVMNVATDSQECPQPQRSFSLESVRFLDNSANQNINMTIFYNCSRHPENAVQHIPCLAGRSFAYVDQEISSNGFNWYKNCEKAVVVPVTRPVPVTRLGDPTKMNYTLALKRGFQVAWRHPVSCEDCRRSLGQCWANETDQVITSPFHCNCTDGRTLVDDVCTDSYVNSIKEQSTGSDGTSDRTVIGIVVGVGVLLLLLLAIFVTSCYSICSCAAPCLWTNIKGLLAICISCCYSVCCCAARCLWKTIKSLLPICISCCNSICSCVYSTCSCAAPCLWKKIKGLFAIGVSCCSKCSCKGLLAICTSCYSKCSCVAACLRKKIKGLLAICITSCYSICSNKCLSLTNAEVFLDNYEELKLQRLKYSDIKKMTNSFEDKLGQGGFGSVFKGKLRDGRLVAVKVLNESKGKGEDLINEVITIGRTNHVNVVSLLGFCLEGTKQALIYEFMPNGSLDKFIFSGKEGSTTSPLLGWEKLHQIALGIARGLEYLHRGCNTRILHLDIKPHNILLDQDYCPKISDFGLAKLCPAKESIVSMTRARGTIGYIAPEVYCGNFGGVSHKSDVYSFGMMTLEMIGGRKNIDVMVSNTSEIHFPRWIYQRLEENIKAQGSETKDIVVSGEVVFEEETTKKMILVALWCIQPHPGDRPSMNKVVDMLEGNIEDLQLPPNPFPLPSSHSSSLP